MKARRTFIGAVICAAAIVGTGAGAFAGEVTGNGKPTPIKTSGVASSDCAFSGLEDGITFAGIDPETGEPIFLPTPTKGPGVVQTPHGEESIGVTFPPGVAGQACRGNLPPGGGA